MVLVKICKLQLIIFYQFYPPNATLLHRFIRGICLYYNKKSYELARQKDLSLDRTFFKIV